MFVYNISTPIQNLRLATWMDISNCPKPQIEEMSNKLCLSLGCGSYLLVSFMTCNVLEQKQEPKTSQNFTNFAKDPNRSETPSIFDSIELGPLRLWQFGQSYPRDFLQLDSPNT